MDGKLKKLLFNIYWRGGKGWKLVPDWPSDEDFKLLVEAGIAEHPKELSHDTVLERYWSLISKVNPDLFSGRFIASFSGKNVEYRSDLMAYAELPKEIIPHSFTGKGFCNRCGVPESHTYDFTKTQFMRYKFGSGSMYFLMQNVFSLESSIKSGEVTPTADDIIIFHKILNTIRSLPGEAGPQQLKDNLKGVFSGNDDSRRNLIELFGKLDILKPSDTSDEAYAAVPTRSNWFGPVCIWKGSDGINNYQLEKWFGKYL